ncbi:MAG: ribose 5-phosphate isomerase B, partial [Candidatus Omnitrophica bacterium]|nr:ribose 5-phosphate isomerase B [Candidatus Omnitrophota bacterium]
IEGAVAELVGYYIGRTHSEKIRTSISSMRFSGVLLFRLLILGPTASLVDRGIDFIIPAAASQLALVSRAGLSLVHGVFLSAVVNFLAPYLSIRAEARLREKEGKNEEAAALREKYTAAKQFKRTVDSIRFRIAPVVIQHDIIQNIFGYELAYKILSRFGLGFINSVFRSWVSNSSKKISLGNKGVLWFTLVISTISFIWGTWSLGVFAITLELAILLYQGKSSSASHEKRNYPARADEQVLKPRVTLVRDDTSGKFVVTETKRWSRLMAEDLSTHDASVVPGKVAQILEGLLIHAPPAKKIKVILTGERGEKIFSIEDASDTITFTLHWLLLTQALPAVFMADLYRHERAELKTGSHEIAVRGSYEYFKVNPQEVIAFFTQINGGAIRLDSPYEDLLASLVFLQVGRNIVRVIIEKKSQGQGPANIVFIGPPGSLKSSSIKIITDILVQRGITIASGANESKRNDLDEAYRSRGDENAFVVFDAKYGAYDAVIAEAVVMMPSDEEKIDLLIRFNGHVTVRQQRITEGSGSYEYAKIRTEIGSSYVSSVRRRKPDIIVSTDFITRTMLNSGSFERLLRDSLIGALEESKNTQRQDSLPDSLDNGGSINDDTRLRWDKRQDTSSVAGGVLALAAAVILFSAYGFWTIAIPIFVSCRFLRKIFLNKKGEPLDNGGRFSRAIKPTRRGMIDAELLRYAGVAVILALLIGVVVYFVWVPVQLFSLFRNPPYDYGVLRSLLAASVISSIFMRILYNVITFFDMCGAHQECPRIPVRADFDDEQGRFNYLVFFGSLTLTSLPFIVISNWGTVLQSISVAFSWFFASKMHYLLGFMFSVVFVLQILRKRAGDFDDEDVNSRIKKGLESTFIASVGEEVLFRFLGFNFAQWLWVSVFAFKEIFDFTLPLFGVAVGFDLPLGVFIAIAGSAESFFKSHGDRKWFHHWFLGLVAAYAYYKTQTLIVPIVLHLTWNAVNSIFELFINFIFPLRGSQNSYYYPLDNGGNFSGRITDTGVSPDKNRREVLLSLLADKLDQGMLIILFVCTSNINRSAAMHMITADYLMRHKLDDIIAVYSGGTAPSAGHRDSGDPSVKWVKECAVRQGLSPIVIDEFISESLDPYTVEVADFILVAEDRHRRIISARYPYTADKIFLFNELLPLDDKDHGTDFQETTETFDTIKRTLEENLFPLFAGVKVRGESFDNGGNHFTGAFMRKFKPSDSLGYSIVNGPEHQVMLMSVKPEDKEAPLGVQLESVLRQVDTTLLAHGFDYRCVVKQDVFLRDIHQKAYSKEIIGNYYGRSPPALRPAQGIGAGVPPATSYIHQPPIDGELAAVELIAVKGRGVKVHRISEFVTLLEADGVWMLYVAGIEPDENIIDTYEQALNTFQKLQKALERVEFGEIRFKFEDVIRTWLFQRDIVGFDDAAKLQERYQKLNQARRFFFDTAEKGSAVLFGRRLHCPGSWLLSLRIRIAFWFLKISLLKRTKFFEKLLFKLARVRPPASTGIGTLAEEQAQSLGLGAGAGFVFEALALFAQPGRDDVAIIFIENPEQTPAFAYSKKVLPHGQFKNKRVSPAFSRGMAVLMDYIMIIISGTASVKGEKVMHVGDVREQTETTIDNIRLVVAQAGATLKDIPQIRVYIKHRQDYQTVRKVVEKYFPDTPALYLLGDICRTEWLVEIEALAFLPRKSAEVVSLDNGGETPGAVLKVTTGNTEIALVRMPQNALYKPAEQVVYAAPLDTWIDGLDIKLADTRKEEIVNNVVTAINDAVRVYEEAAGMPAVVAVVSYWTNKKDEAVAYHKHPFAWVMQEAARKANKYLIESGSQARVLEPGCLQIDGALKAKTYAGKTGVDASRWQAPNIFVFPTVDSYRANLGIVEFLSTRTSLISAQEVATPYVQDLEEQARTKNARLVVSEAFNWYKEGHPAVPEVFYAIERFLKNEIGTLMILGERNRIDETAFVLGLDIHGAVIVDPKDMLMFTDEKGKRKVKPEMLEKYAPFYCKARGFEPTELNLTTARSTLNFYFRNEKLRPLFYGAAMVAAGQADCMPAGKVYDSGDVFMSVKLLVGTRRDSSTPSGDYVMCFPGVGHEGKIIIADMASEECPQESDTHTQLSDIIINTASDVSSYIGEKKPRIAFAYEGQTKSAKATQALKRAKSIVGDSAVIDGPMPIRRALEKGYSGVVCSDLSTANPAYKAFQRIAGFVGLAIVTGGAAKPVLDVSRGADQDEYYTSLVFACDGVIYPILVLNCGSSSVKAQLIDVYSGRQLRKYNFEKIGKIGGKFAGHEDAITFIIGDLPITPYAVGHRVVHGGERFIQPALIDEQVKATIRRYFALAPLHNPPNLKGIEICEKALPGILQIAVFDTAFHHTIWPEASLYGLPWEDYVELEVRRYGFHGSSHEYVTLKAAEMLGIPSQRFNAVSIHLGAGASGACICNGESIDTSMGLGPLEGFVMAKRPGDTGLEVVRYLMEQRKLGFDQVMDRFNNQSGLIGLSGVESGDMRDIKEVLGIHDTDNPAQIEEDVKAIHAYAAQDRDIAKKRAAIALKVFAYRIAKYIGAYFMVLGNVDAIIFTGGIGEKDAHVRQLILDYCKALSASDKKRKVLVIPTNEELMIARHVFTLINTKPLDNGGENQKNIIAIGSDHGGLDLKEFVKLQLVAMGFDVIDLGTYSRDSCDYPDFAKAVAKGVLSSKFSKGVLICTTGIGISIAANRFKGIRAALCRDVDSAKLTREHNDANILVLGAKYTDEALATAIVNTFFTTPYSNEARHSRRIEKIDDNTSLDNGGNKRRLIVLDLDETLYVCPELDCAYTQHYYEFTALQGISEQIARETDRQTRSIAKAFEMLRIPLKDFQTYHIARIKIADLHLQSSPLIRPALESLKNAGHVVVLLTNNDRTHTQDILKVLGLDSVFERVYITSELGMSKPDSRLFEIIMTQLCFKACDSISIGDSLERDIAPAQTLGIQGILISGPDDLAVKLEALIKELENHKTSLDNGGRQEMDTIVDLLTLKGLSLAWEVPDVISAIRNQVFTDYHNRSGSLNGNERRNFIRVSGGIGAEDEAIAPYADQTRMPWMILPEHVELFKGWISASLINKLKASVDNVNGFLARLLLGLRFIQWQTIIYLTQEEGRRYRGLPVIFVHDDSTIESAALILSDVLEDVNQLRALRSRNTALSCASNWAYLRSKALDDAASAGSLFGDRIFGASCGIVNVIGEAEILNAIENSAYIKDLAIPVIHETMHFMESETEHEASLGKDQYERAHLEVTSGFRSKVDMIFEWVNQRVFLVELFSALDITDLDQHRRTIPVAVKFADFYPEAQTYTQAITPDRIGYLTVDYDQPFNGNLDRLVREASIEFIIPNRNQSTLRSELWPVNFYEPNYIGNASIRFAYRVPKGATHLSFGAISDRRIPVETHTIIKLVEQESLDNGGRRGHKESPVRTRSGSARINVVLDLGKGKVKVFGVDVPRARLARKYSWKEEIHRLINDIYSSLNIFNACNMFFYAEKPNKIINLFIDRLISSIVNPRDPRFHIVQSLAQINHGYLGPDKDLPFQLRRLESREEIAWFEDARQHSAVTSGATEGVSLPVTSQPAKRACIMNPKNTIGFDVGGSNLRVVAYGKSGDLVFAKDHPVEIGEFTQVDLKEYRGAHPDQEIYDSHFDVMRVIGKLAQLAVTLNNIPFKERNRDIDILVARLQVIERDTSVTISDIVRFIEEIEAVLQAQQRGSDDLGGVGISWPDIIADNRIVGLDTNKTQGLAGRHDADSPRDEIVMGKYDSQIMARQFLGLYALKLCNIGMDLKGRLVRFSDGSALTWSGRSPPEAVDLFERIKDAARILGRKKKPPYILDKFHQPKRLSEFSSLAELKEYLKNNFIIKDASDVISLLEAALGEAHLEGIDNKELRSLYERLFRFNEQKTKHGWDTIKIVMLRGGRGSAGDYIKYLRECTGDNINITFIPGAIDDGRSWLLYSLLFGFTGAPDFGKSLLDLARDDTAKFLLAKRFGSLEEMREASCDIIGVVCRGQPEQRVREVKTWAQNNPGTLADIQKYVGVFYGELHRLIAQEDIVFAREKSAEIIGRQRRDLAQALWVYYASLLKGELRSQKRRFGLTRRLEAQLDELFKSSTEETPEDKVKAARRIVDELPGILKGLPDRNQERKFLEALVYSNARFPKFGTPLRSTVIVGHWIAHGRGDVQDTLDAVARILDLRDGDRVVTPTKGRRFLNVVTEKGTVFNNEDSINEADKDSEFYAVFISRRPLTLQQMKKLETMKGELTKEGRLDVAKAVTQSMLSGMVEHFNDKQDLEAHGAAIDTIRVADLIIFANTTLVSNLSPAAIMLGPWIQESPALRIMAINSFLESDPPNTTGGSAVENLIRFLKGQQRYVNPGRIGLPDTYTPLFSPIHYGLGRMEGMFAGEGKQLTYIDHDPHDISERGVVPIVSDVEAVDWKGEGYMPLYGQGYDSAYWQEARKLGSLNEALEETLGAEVVIANDGDVAAFGASVMENKANVAALTLGTSLGGGIGFNVIGQTNYLAYFGRVVNTAAEYYVRHRTTMVENTYSIYLSQAGVVRLAELKGIRGIYEYGKDDRAKLRYIQSQLLQGAPHETKAKEIFEQIGNSMASLVAYLYKKFNDEGVDEFVIFGAVAEERKAARIILNTAQEKLDKEFGKEQVTLKFSTQLADVEETIGKKLTRIRPEFEGNEEEKFQFIQSMSQAIYAAWMGYAANRGG